MGGEGAGVKYVIQSTLHYRRVCYLKQKSILWWFCISFLSPERDRGKLYQKNIPGRSTSLNHYYQSPSSYHSACSPVSSSSTGQSRTASKYLKCFHCDRYSHHGKCFFNSGEKNCHTRNWPIGNIAHIVSGKSNINKNLKIKMYRFLWFPSILMFLFSPRNSLAFYSCIYFLCLRIDLFVTKFFVFSWMQGVG